MSWPILEWEAQYVPLLVLFSTHRSIRERTWRGLIFKSSQYKFIKHSGTYNSDSDNWLFGLQDINKQTKSNINVSGHYGGDFEWTPFYRVHHNDVKDYHHQQMSVHSAIHEQHKPHKARNLFILLSPCPELQYRILFIINFTSANIIFITFFFRRSQTSLTGLISWRLTLYKIIIKHEKVGKWT